jgi:hypothetical protein
VEICSATRSAVALVAAVFLVAPGVVPPTGGSSRTTGSAAAGRVPAPALADEGALDGPHRYRGFDAVAEIGPSDVWAVGSSDSHAFARHWNGKHWVFVRTPHSAPGYHDSLSAVSAVSHSDVWAVGSTWIASDLLTIAMHWNGRRWRLLPTPSPGYETGLTGVVAVSSDDVWAVGTAYIPPGGSTTVVEHWDGSSWQLVRSPNTKAKYNGLRAVSALSASDIWAVGSTGQGTSESTLVEHWDGQRWRIIPTPDLDIEFSGLEGVAARSSDDVWAVGDSMAADGGLHQTLIEHWDGTGWSVVPSPNPPGWPSLQSVSLAGPSEVWAVGYTEIDDPYSSQTLIEHWDGEKWSYVPSQDAPGYNWLYGVTSTPDGDAWAIGTYNNEGLLRTLREHWDGSSWSLR